LNKFSYCWPKDWLAYDLVTSLRKEDKKLNATDLLDQLEPDEVAIDKFRLLGVDYETFYSLWGKELVDDRKLKSNIKQQALNLVSELEMARLTARRPIVWVCHSMGGLIVKQLLVHLDETNNNMLENTKAIVFISTPHTGSQLGSLVAKLGFVIYPSQEVLDLSANSQYLVELNQKFLKLMNGKLKDKVTILSMCEDLPLCIGQWLGLGNRWHTHVVEPQVADIGIGDFTLVKEKDHLNVCKPNDRNCIVYTKIKKQCLSVMAEESDACEKCKLNEANERSRKYGAYLFEFFKLNYFF
jgi:hypothetical protein